MLLLRHIENRKLGFCDVEFADPDDLPSHQFRLHWRPDQQTA